MTANFNRGFPLQPFAFNNRAGAAVIPGPTSATPFAGNPIAVLIFIATATASSTRTASATASVSFVATVAGDEREPGGVTCPALEGIAGNNIVGVGQSIFRSSVAW